MKPSEALFNRDLYELEYEYLQEFFSTSKDENLYLEFKSYDARGAYKEKEDTIKKAVCGMLNSEGGIIIWGAPIETRDENKNTVAIGELTPFASALDRDKLINILSSSIIPLPVGIRVQALQNENQDSVFVIEVEKSPEKPHQFDNRYYIRLDGQTRIAPHYLISALMKGINFPVLTGHLRLKQISNDGRNNILLYFRNVLFNTSAFNNDINVQKRIVTSKGQLLINGEYHDLMYFNTMPLLSHGAPTSLDFILQIPAAHAQGELTIVFQFGGEKSPSKMSTYKYRFERFMFGNVADESIYLVKKKENSLPKSDHMDSMRNVEDVLNS
ncbi:helix-turn-helix domain-containing protein [Flavobacterium sp. Root420]|uniref:AlbA family DNA-binding domain-containing protein n=1 Tax=Flavobacterium sp. Root420 TaxID=1736533 RepID=UPI0006FB6BD2|nr:ATP-binding protein [Flavobacterium sp. Root420]KQX00769.1 hypothetical protein ASC72_07860 [Flavobacterium sp. Root420]